MADNNNQTIQLNESQSAPVAEPEKKEPPKKKLIESNILSVLLKKLKVHTT